jgi:transketolase
MRTRLSQLLTDACSNNPMGIVLSGDHGYALFDQLRKTQPDQFVNVGISEQAMIGYAAGLARIGFRPIVYGLAAFVPIRVLEQIKLDVCHANLPVIMLGDGAGLVYSTLGNSHQCAEDVACLRPLPNLRIYAPCDAEELQACFVEAQAYSGPSYIRIGKSDRPAVHTQPLANTGFQVLRKGSGKTCLVAMGSFVSLADELGKKLGLPVISVPRIKPMDPKIAQVLTEYTSVVVLEEHSRYGGLYSSLCEHLCESGLKLPRMHSLSLTDHFVHRCGSYQFALSEHGMSDPQVESRVIELLSQAT